MVGLLVSCVRWTLFDAPYFTERTGIDKHNSGCKVGLGPSNVLQFARMRQRQLLLVRLQRVLRGAAIFIQTKRTRWQCLPFSDGAS
jgi:hypothetical protein